MKRILIADAGSTKSDWALIDEAGNEIKRFTSDGLNALTAAQEALDNLILEVKNQLPEDIDINAIHYYGAGCSTSEICQKVEKAISARFVNSDVKATTDLLGAARSLLGRESGIACILGTGSNSCLYDGTAIVANIPSLGFILGDEGSGAALGKRLVADAFKGTLPSLVKTTLMKRYQLTLGEILDKVYRSPAPGKFLASLVPFIKEHLWNPYVYSMVRQEFDNFLNRNVSGYEDARSVPISFTGSIAFHFSDILRESAEEGGYRVGKIIPKPMEGLINYHKNPK